MTRQRGGLYLQTDVDENDEPVFTHIDDLPAEQRDAIRTLPPVPPAPVRATRGGIYIDDEDADADGKREPPVHVDDLTTEERTNRIQRVQRAQRGGRP